MNDIKNFIKAIKNIDLSNSEVSELDELKDVVVKFLVDIQLQKDINAKISQHESRHSTSTEDIELKIIDNVPQKDEPTITIREFSEETIIQDNVETKQQVTEYSQTIIQETISEEILSIYEAKTPEIKIKEESAPSNSSTPDISFSINDKFSFIKHLFKNNTDNFNSFLAELNKAKTLSDSENLIDKYASQYSWNDNSIELKNLRRLNKQRFK